MLRFIHYIFTAYTLLLAARIISSWFPSTRGQTWLYWVSKLTDPYLNVFRRIVPPIGGVLDLSPMLGFLGLQLFEQLLYKIIR
jgi:YggT family protein